MKQPSAAQKRRWNALTELGCIVSALHQCGPRLTIHHCFTGAGGRKDHWKTICLCWNLHLGPEGIDGQAMSKRAWQAKFGAEQALLEKTNKLLEGATL